jgi:hypothetical protein
MPVASILGDEYEVQLLIEDGQLVIQITQLTARLDIAFNGPLSHYRIEETQESSPSKYEKEIAKLADDKNIPHEPRSLSLIYVLAITTGALVVVMLGVFVIFRNSKRETNESTALLKKYQSNYYTSINAI